MCPIFGMTQTQTNTVYMARVVLGEYIPNQPTKQNMTTTKQDKQENKQQPEHNHIIRIKKVIKRGGIFESHDHGERKKQTRQCMHALVDILLGVHFASQTSTEAATITPTGTKTKSMIMTMKTTRRRSNQHLTYETDNCHLQALVESGRVCQDYELFVIVLEFPILQEFDQTIPWQNHRH